MKLPSPIQNLSAWSRRRFVQGLAAGGVLAGMPDFLQASGQVMGATQLGVPQVLTGTEIFLTVAESPVNFTGTMRMATTINGSIPAPTLRLREGDEVTIRVTNHLSVPTSIHWHGIILPFQMDGVPGVSFHGIAPGETFVYRFTLNQSGTYWYHSHSGYQEMTGMYGALIIEPREQDIIRANRDYIVQLSDWTDESPLRVLSQLKAQSDLYNFNQSTAIDFVQDAAAHGVMDALQMRKMWNEMRMKPTDLADLSSETLTYLMNGTTPAGNWTGLFNPGERIRLRFINAAGNTFYDVRIPGLAMIVVQVDGQNVVPVNIEEFRFGPGETYDVVVEPEAEDAYTIFAQSMDRTGYARGTLARRRGMTAHVPEVDPAQWLSMTDMMGSMDHGDMGHEAMGHGAMNHKDMNHGATNESDKHQSHMHHGGMAMDHSAHAGHQKDLSVPSKTVNHARTEYGPSVDMRVNTPRTNLDDPGVGLRNNGRRVLTLSQLRSLDGIIESGGPEREIELHLTGNMERYTWSFDGLEFGQSTPVHMVHNQRIRIILQNDTMMTHPMHLHGMWSDLEDDQGNVLVRRHTIPVQPAQRISFLTTPYDVGRWVWHCHLQFHMDAGMMRLVVVS